MTRKTKKYKKKKRLDPVKERLDLVKGTKIDNWVVGIFLGIFMSTGAFFMVISTNEFLRNTEAFPEGTTFFIGLAIVICGVWIGQKYQIERR